MSEHSKFYYLPIEHSFIAKDILITKNESVELGFIQKEIALKEAINSINQQVIERGGFILGDGQILINIISMSDVLDYGINLIELNEIQEFSPREWGAKQKEFFKISSPYQLSEDNGEYSFGWILINSHEKYLSEGERIFALLHGEKDERPFYCPCHNAQVVYTSYRRFVCMMCGMLHCVLEKALYRSFTSSMSAEEWFDYFSQDGSKQEEVVDVDIVDFQDIENLPKIWTTDQYEGSANELVFFSRSSPEELEEYY